MPPSVSIDLQSASRFATRCSERSFNLGYDIRDDIEGSASLRRPHVPHEPSEDDSIGLIDAIIGLLVEPRETVRELFSQKPPLFVPALLNIFVLVVFLPIVVQTLRWDFLQTRLFEIACLAFVLSLTAMLFILLEKVVLLLWREPLGLSDILAIFVYGCTPLIPIILSYYLFDLLRYGRLATVTYIITGVAPPGDWATSFLPLAHLLAKVLFLVVFYHSVRLLRKSGPVTSFLIVLFSSIPFYLSLGMALCTSEALVPGSTIGIQGFILSILQPLYPH